MSDPTQAGVFDLGGEEWTFGPARAQPLDFTGDDRHAVTEWLPACVPGNVRADLLAAGRIHDPFYGLQLAESDWVDAHDWWYRRKLVQPLGPSQRAFVRFAGIDYISAAFTADQRLGRHEGMFSAQTFELTSHLWQSPEMELAVRIWGSASLPRLQRSIGQRIGRQLARTLRMSELPNPDRLAALKCPMSYGWDFAPRLLSMGIWDDVTLRVCDTAAILDLWPRVEWPAGTDGNPAAVDICLAIEIDSAVETPVLLQVGLAGANFACAEQSFEFRLDLRRGRRDYAVRFTLDSPALWQPWDRGAPNLYRLAADLRHLQDGRLLDSSETTIGVRRVQLTSSRAGKDSGNWTWEVNGQQEFIRGVNWAPADALPGRLRAPDYESLVRMARDAGVNQFRVWGGGLREKRAFYDACDRAGLLIWQEFPLACVFLGRLPRSNAYLTLLRQESRAIVRELRNHPSVALWCGGNEFSPTRNRSVVNVLWECVGALDGTRPFVPASPGPGDRHNWDVWHGGAPASDYRRDQSAFISEFGLGAAPDVETLSCFLPDDLLWPAGEGWVHHHAQLKKLVRYAGVETSASLDEFVHATQRAQARALQVAIEHVRRRKGDTGGLAIWQWNEPWPAICWSLVDYYRRPKLAAQMLARWYSPLLVSLEYPLRGYADGDSLEAALWIVNDWREAFCECEVRIRQGDRALWVESVDVTPDDSRRVRVVTLDDIRVAEPLAVELWSGRRRLTCNDYDLSYFSRHRRMSATQRLRRRVADWLVSR